MQKLQIIYKNNKPYGIRDSDGYLFFFAGVSKFPGQEERYRKEVEDQYKLADYLLSVLPVPNDWQSLDTEQKLPIANRDEP